MDEGDKLRTLEILAIKEQLLSEILVWLKAKGLYKDAVNDIATLQMLEKNAMKKESV